MKKLWGARFKQKTHPLVEKFTASIGYDYKLAKYDVLVSMAHARMLGATGIISPRESAKIVQGLKSILKQIEQGKFVFDQRAEDIHTLIQNALEKKIGQAAARLHTARSRNDQVATDLRMYAKEEIENLQVKIKRLQQVLLKLARKNREVVIPGLTHLQHAQPVSLGHHLLAYVEMLQRDRDRLGDAYRRCDVLPLGAGALAGTSLPIDRGYLARLLGFREVSANSIDAVSDRDFVLEILSALAILAMHLSRMAEDFLLWTTAEFNLWELGDAFATGSSLMPQKKNPDVLELVRASTAGVYAELLSLLTTMKALPLAYNRDMQLDKLSLFRSLEGLNGCLEVFCPLLKSARVNRVQASKLCADELLCATDLVEYLVKKGVAFQKAEQIVGGVIALALRQKRPLSALPLTRWQRFCPYFAQDIFKLLNARVSVQAKKSFGGTSPQEVNKQLTLWKKRL